MTIPSAQIAFFKKEAKRLIRQVEDHDPKALMRFKSVLRDPLDMSLMRAQHVVAVEYGFSKWEDLICASPERLQTAINAKRLRIPKPSGTPLGNFLRGPGVLPTPPHLEQLADMFDRMTMEEQRRYLDEDAQRMGLR